MRLRPEVFDVVTTEAVSAGLLDEAAARQAMALVDGGTPFGDAVSLAESVHLHCRVADLRALPPLDHWGQAAVRRLQGYVKHAFAGGITLVFSTEPVAEDDLLPGAAGRSVPFVDHIGVDVRRHTPEAEAVWEAIPAVAEAAGWRAVLQPGPVRAFRTEVDAKVWAFPPHGDPASTLPLEFPIGQLRVHDSDIGCDLRPLDPAHPAAAARG